MNRGKAQASGGQQWIRPAEIAFAWLLACLVLGGSSNGGAKANLLLQCGAAVLIAAAIWRGQAGAWARGERQLAFLLAGLVAWIGLTLVPLPPWLWTSLPGRDFLADGYRLLGMDLPWLPISLTDDRTLRSGLALLVPLATYLAIRPLGAKARLRIAALIAGFALVSVALGMAQLASGQGSPLRFYAATNRGNPVGFFANTNHFATLLLIAVPLLFAAGLGLRRKAKRQAVQGEWQPLTLACLALLVLGLVLSGSNAAVVLLVPSLAGALLLGPLQRLAANPLAIRVLGVAAVAAVLLVGLSTVTGVLQQRVGVSATSREQVTGQTVAAAKSYLPVGSGLGSFSAIYLKHSGGEKSASEWMNHAHDDPAEVLLELGLPGLLLMLGFVLWLVRAAWRAWLPVQAASADPLVRAAALGLVLAATHSLVDYPLRTAAMAAVFAALLALLASQPPEEPQP
jgi:O-antigen ligase